MSDKQKTGIEIPSGETNLPVESKKTTEALAEQSKREVDQFIASGEIAAKGMAERADATLDELIKSELAMMAAEAKQASKTFLDVLDSVSLSVFESGRRALDVVTRSAEERRIHRALASGDVGRANKLLSSDSLTPEQLRSPDMQRAVLRFSVAEIAHLLPKPHTSSQLWSFSHPRFEAVLKVVEKVGLTREQVCADETIQKAVLKHLLNLLDYGSSNQDHFFNAALLMEDIPLSPGYVTPELQQEVLRGFSIIKLKIEERDTYYEWNNSGRSSYERLVKVTERVGVPREQIIANPYVHSASVDAMVWYMVEENKTAALKAKEFGGLSLEDPELKKGILRGFAKTLHGFFDLEKARNFVQLAERSGISKDEWSQDPDIRAAGIELCVEDYISSSGRRDPNRKIAEFFDLSPVTDVLPRALVRLEQGDVNCAYAIGEIPGRAGFNRNLSMDIKAAAKKGALFTLAQGKMDNLDRLLEVAGLSEACWQETEFQTAVKTGILVLLKKKHYRNLDRLALITQIPEAVWQDPEVQAAAKEALHAAVSRSDWDVESLKTYEVFPGLRETMRLFLRIAESPSQSIQRMRFELVKQLEGQENPLALLDSIESVFVRNNLPEAGKLIRVFEILNPPAVLNKKLSREHLSPTLKAQKYRGRMMAIYRDLLRAHVDSNNLSLRSYLELFDSVQPLLVKVDTEGDAGLSEEEQKTFEKFCAKLATLYENSQLGRSHGAENEPEKTKKPHTREAYERLKESLALAPGQTVPERISEMFLKPAGFGSLEQALARMDGARAAADGRGRALAAKMARGAFALRATDMLKGVKRKFFARQLEGGVLCKEFLGADAGSDSTPLDTDLERVKDVQESIRKSVGSSVAGGYGELLLLVRERGQFVHTDQGEKESMRSRDIDPDHPRYELFGTKVEGDRHVGIRTGFASTEIDAVIVKDEIRDDARALSGLKTEIAQAGWYMPIVDEDGKLLLSPKEFDEIRRSFFAGVTELGGPAFALGEVKGQGGDQGHQAALETIVAKKHIERSKLKETTAQVRGIIEQVAGQLGMAMHESGDTSLLGVRLYDTGSSGRETNVPGAFDYDWVMKLDIADMKRVNQVHDALLAACTTLDGTPHEADKSDQLRMLGVRLPGLEEPVDIDVGLVPKYEIDVFESHDAVKSRLESVRREQGEAAHDQVVANIVLTKQVLKDAKAYKKGEFGEGGLGGIGVENWVLSHGGDTLAAFKTLHSAATDASGARRPFEEFKADYKILDPGINVKFGFHDNFILQLTESGYQKMTHAIQEYLKAHVKESK